MLEWDYTALAPHYRLRAPYAQAALDELFATIGAERTGDCVDIGAGTGRLSAMLVSRGLRVIAVEPNAGMREIGRREVPEACWIAARGEATGLAQGCCGLLTFGSSFNVMPAGAALDTAARLLRPGGWLAVAWNHRDLDDPLQASLQAAIRNHVPTYAHGARRDDPTPSILADGRFSAVRVIAATLVHATSTQEFLAGFLAHATLIRQAGDALPLVLDEMKDILRDRSRIEVPFTTRIYVARRNETP